MWYNGNIEGIEGEKLKFEQALEQVDINTDLKVAVLNGMPNNLNKMEQVVYVYAKLCSILNYDAQFWASNQNDGPRGIYHLDLDNIKNINLYNTAVVCYDFSLIFAKFLEDIGVEYEFVGFDNRLEYGEHADIVISFLQEDVGCRMKNFFTNVYFAGYNDMKHFKIDDAIFPYLVKRDINGRPDDMVLSFYLRKVCKNMVSLIKKQEIKDRLQLTNELVTKKLEKTYIKDFGILQSLDEEEKIDTLLKLMINFDMDNYDICFYRKKIFKDFVNNIKSDKLYTYTILREQSEEDDDLYNMFSVLNICGDDIDIYIKFGVDGLVDVCQHCDIQAGFDTGKYDYIHEAGMLWNTAVLPRIMSKYINKEYRDIIEKNKIDLKPISVCLKELEDNQNSTISPQLAVYSMNYNAIKNMEMESENEASRVVTKM